MDPQNFHHDFLIPKFGCYAKSDEEMPQVVLCKVEILTLIIADIPCSNDIDIQLVCNIM